VLGKPNTADAVTSLSGSAAANLKITNTQAASPALDLRVALDANGYPVVSYGDFTGSGL
jgi:hypothetical protein